LRLLPVVVFLAALLIRLPGIGWGLKNDLHQHSYHPDELLVWVQSQRIEPAKLDFTPGFYNYGTLYLSTLRIASDMTAAYTGGPDPRSEESLWAFVSRAHMAGRLLSAIAGAGTALVVFLLLRRRIGNLGALMGSALIVVAPGHVVHSRFQTVDVLATFFLALSALFALRLLDRREDESGMRDALLAGLFAGLSAGVKYTGILGILTLLVVLALARRKHLAREGLAGVAMAVVSFLLVTPGALLESDQFWRDFRYEMTHTATGHGLVFTGTASGFGYHFSNLLYGVGTILTVVGLVGLGMLAFRKQVWVLALLAFFVPYYILIGRAEVKFLRYTFPLYVGLAAGFGAAMSEAHRRGGWGRAAVAVGILGLGGVDSRGLIGAGQATAWMMGEDPRDQAVRWLRSPERAPVASVGLVEDPWFWNPPLSPKATSLRVGPSQRPTWLADIRATSNPPLTLAQDPAGNVNPFDPALISLQPQYIAFSSLESDPRGRLVGRTDVPDFAKAEASRFVEFMKALSERYEATPTQFGAQTQVVEDMQYIHPVVLVWKRK
jgi:uncharacterized membrane protein